MSIIIEPKNIINISSEDTDKIKLTNIPVNLFGIEKVTNEQSFSPCDTTGEITVDDVISITYTEIISEVTYTNIVYYAKVTTNLSDLISLAITGYEYEHNQYTKLGANNPTADSNSIIVTDYISINSELVTNDVRIPAATNLIIYKVDNSDYNSDITAYLQIKSKMTASNVGESEAVIFFTTYGTLTILYNGTSETPSTEQYGAANSTASWTNDNSELMQKYNFPFSGTSYTENADIAVTLSTTSSTKTIYATIASALSYDLKIWVSYTYITQIGVLLTISAGGTQSNTHTTLSSHTYSINRVFRGYLMSSYIGNKVLDKYSNGINVITATFLLTEYYDSSGNLAISRSNASLPMCFSVGDIVTPYIKKKGVRISYRSKEDEMPISYKITSITTDTNKGLVAQKIVAYEHN